MSDRLTSRDPAAKFDAFNDHDAKGVMNRFADDCVFTTVGGPEFYGNKIEGANLVTLREGWIVLEQASRNDRSLQNA